MGSRREGREMALQALYLSDTASLPIETALKSTLEEVSSSAIREFSKHLATGVDAMKEGIDVILTRNAQNWDVKRMTIIDRNILRIATYEIIRDTETPISVIIDEAIEIAKTFSTEDSGKFVNGILDKVKTERKTSA